MLTRHIIAITVVINQTFIHFGVRHGADVSKAIGADQCTHIMLTRHIIAIIVVVNQTFLHFGVKQCADVSEQGPQLCADQRTQTHAPESDMNIFSNPAVISITGRSTISTCSPRPVQVH